MAQHTITFDTLRYSKKLQKAGFTETQAEAQIEIIKEQADAINDLIDNSLATKVDIKRLEERMALSEERTNERIVQMGYKIIIGLGGMITAGITILGFLVELH